MSQGYVYFIECMDKVKIGYSEDPHRRLTKINADSPGPCSLLGYVSADDFPESEIHERFASVRVHSEWFALTEEIKAFIRATAIKDSAEGLDRYERKDLSNASPLLLWRYTQKLTQKQISAKVGVAQCTWLRWEAGTRPIPSIRVLAVEALTGISRHDLRPDVFGRLPAKAEHLA